MAPSTAASLATDHDLHFVYPAPDALARTAPWAADLLAPPSLVVFSAVLMSGDCGSIPPAHRRATFQTLFLVSDHASAADRYARARVCVCVLCVCVCDNV